MQSLKIPQGPRNPNNYTAEEIEAALKGATGSRQFSFRYELLDEKNRYQRDLLTVHSGKVSQNWLADIKRTASFILRSGFEDPIDYLKDRIKPVVRLHMPPKPIPDPDPVLPPEPPTPPAFGALTDDFSTAEMSSVWTYYANGVSNVGGHLVIPTKPSWPGAATEREWSLIGSQVACEVTRVPTITEGATDVAVSVVVGSNTAGTNLTIQYRLTGYGVTNKMEFLNFHDGYQDATSVSIDYDPDEHKWWRIWESAGTVFWGTSRTGLPGTWQVHRQEPTPAWLTAEAGTLELFVQANGDALGDGGGDYAEIGRLNLTPEGVEQAFMPQTEWRNNFNGTPGVSGEPITTNNSARHGNALDDVQGSAIYDDTHSAENAKSAKLGDDLGTSGGALVASLRTALPEWSLRTYFYLPAGGTFSIKPYGPNTNPNYDLTFNDAGGVYKLGTATIPAYVRSNLVDRLVKVEIITNEDASVYRLFWTDPSGSSPDYVTSETNLNRDPLLTVTLSGGGSATPPVWVDNLLVAEPRTYQRFTDNSVNWVEWPQGVFVLSSPQRESNEANTITREIQGYDLAQVLQDDQVDDRFSTANLLRVNDNFTREESGSWGTSQDGTVWLQAAASATVGVSLSGYAYATLNGSPGTIRLFQAGSTMRQVLVDSEVYTRIAVSEMATGAGFLPSVVFRLASSSRYYRLRVLHNTDGSLSLAVTMGPTQFGPTRSVGFSYSPNTFVNVRAQCIGHVVRGKVWRDGTAEPSGWMIEEEITNPADQIDVGFTGLSASSFANNTNANPTFRYDLFQLNPNPKNLYTGVVEHILTLADIPKKITPSNATLPVVKEWEAGTSKREIINDLLAAINYESLSFDEEGYAVVKPYISPQERGSEFTYQDDELSVMYPEVMQELDLFSVPNRWILTVSDPDRESIVVDFTNNDPASPTSTVRRGRTITAFVQEQDADSEATLVQKAARYAFEASQVYEAIEFDTGLMPFHSGNDVYTLRYDPLGINGQYSEVSWEMDLQAGAKMRHRARRVISLRAGKDPSIVDDDLEVTGAIEAGNIAVGSIQVTPVANKPTRVRVTGLNLQGRGPVQVFATPVTTVPGSIFKEVTTADHTPFGFSLWVYRTSSSATTIHWMAIRGA